MTTLPARPTRTPPEVEEQRLEGMIARRPDHIVIVSDLHLGPGQDLVTGRWSAQENFTADFAFARLLGQLRGLAGHVLLVLNGDSFDFVRLDETPKDPELGAWAAMLANLGCRRSVEELNASIGSVERRFGLRTDDYKSVWKLDRICRGHPQFLAALAEWVRDGRDLLVLTGNHDVELYWQLVRDAFRWELSQCRADLARTTAHVAFCEGWTQIANVYIEHGHQYEELTRVEGTMTLATDPSQLNLPFGSFVNRYLINPLEHIDPFLDNIKPVPRVLRELLRRHPIRSLMVLRHSLRFLRRAVKARRFRDGVSFAFYFGSLLAPALGLALVAVSVITIVAGRQLTGNRAVEVAVGMLGLAAPYLYGVIVDSRDWLARRSHRARGGEDAMAAALATELDTRLRGPSYDTTYAVLGHTHRQDTQDITTRGHRMLYVNTGTWIPLWPRERPDLIGKVLHPVVHFRRSGAGYQFEYREWNDTGRHLEEASIIKTS